MDDPVTDYDIAQYRDLTQSWHQDPTAYLKRYYSLYFRKPQGSSAMGVYVRQAPSKVCVLGLSQPPKGIHSLHMHTELIGEKVKEDTILCDLLDKEGSVIGYVRAEMEGKLLELNARFSTTKDQQQEEDTVESLLYKDGHHMDIGFIGIILPRFEDTEKQLREFISEEEYRKSVS